MKTMNSNAVAAIAEQFGNESIIILDVEWTQGTHSLYADRAIPPNVEGRIKSISNLDEVSNITGNSVSLSVNVTLADTDGVVKGLMDRYDIHKRPVKIYQYFVGLDLSDKFEIFRGQINSPITWNEFTKDVEFTVLSEIESNEIGFAPEEGQFGQIPDTLVGSVWPLCFGDSIHVPATKINTTPTGQVGQAFGIADASLQLKKRFLNNRLNDMYKAFGFYNDAIDYIDYLNSPEQEQLDFLDICEEQDELSQEREDNLKVLEKLNKQIDTLLQLYQDGGAVQSEVLQDIKDLRVSQHDRAEDLQRITERLIVLDRIKKEHQINIQNIRYGYDIVNKIRNYQAVIVAKYFETQRQMGEIDAAIASQAAILANPVLLSGSHYFPQNVSRNFLIDRIMFRGTVSGHNLFLDAPVATNTNVAIDFVRTFLSGDLDTFYLLDGTIDVNGHFATLADGTIIKIASQNGAECKLQLVKKPNDERFKKDRYSFDDVPASRVLQDFQSYIKDSDLESQILQIMNEIPRTLSAKIWKRINKDGDTVKLKQINKCVSGTFYLIYKDEYTDTGIPFDADADTIKWHLSQLKEMQDADGFIIESVTGSLRDNGTVVIKFKDPKDMHPILVDDADLVGPLDHAGKPKGPLPRIIYEFDSGLQEYTADQRKKIIDEAIAKNGNKSALTQANKKLKDLKELRRQAIEQGIKADQIRKIDDAIAETTKKLKDLNDRAIGPNDAYKRISDKEYALLYDLQILDYLILRRAFTPISVNLEQGPDPNDYFTNKFAILHLFETSPVILDHWLQHPLYSDDYAVLSIPQNEAFVAQVGTEVQLFDFFQEKYCCNILPSTIKAVYAYRSINGLRALVPVPYRYYRKNENEQFGNLNITSISLAVPLSKIKDQNWEDQIYVTLTSSVGPNPADVLKWIAETYSTLEVDTDTYDETFTNCENYPADFFLLDKKDAFSAIEEIAFQSRCAVWIKEGKLFMRYLPTEPDVVDSITLSDILEQSLSMEYTPTEELVTKLTGTWVFNGIQDKPNKTIVRHNIARYGEKKDEFNFYSITHPQLAYKTATFWSIMKSNTWKKITFKTPLNKMHLEAFDPVTIDIAHFSSEPVTGIIENASYDSSDNTMTMTVWLPIRAGEMTKYDFAFAGDVEVDINYPPIEDITVGNAGSINQDVRQGNLTYSPLAPDTINYRPKDYGEIKTSDLAFTAPPRPAADYAEKDYNDVQANNPKLEEPDNDAAKEPRNDALDDINKGEAVAQDKSIQHALGGEPTFVGFGRIMKLDTMEVDQPDTVEGGIDKPKYVIQSQFYEVRLTDGRRVKVRQNQIHYEERLPLNACCLVVWDKTSSEYQMQMPIWLPETVTDLAEVEDIDLDGSTT